MRLKTFVAQSGCALFCDTFNMLALSPYDDSSKRRVIRRRHREEGVANKSNKFEKNKKNSAIVRVCQLRMIVWLVDPPLVSSAGYPRAAPPAAPAHAGSRLP